MNYALQSVTSTFQSFFYEEKEVTFSSVGPTGWSYHGIPRWKLSHVPIIDVFCQFFRLHKLGYRRPYLIGNMWISVTRKVDSWVGGLNYDRCPSLGSPLFSGGVKVLANTSEGCWEWLCPEVYSRKCDLLMKMVIFVIAMLVYQRLLHACDRQDKGQLKQEWKEHHFALHVYRKWPGQRASVVIHGILWGLCPSRRVPGLVNVNTLRTWTWWFSSWIYPY